MKEMSPVKLSVFTLTFAVGYLGNYIFNPVNKFIELNTPYGSIRGYESESRDSRKFWKFKSVPFARPPVGDLRFQPPQPYDSWGPEILDAKNSPPACTQYDTLLRKIAGQEDCLYLNIYTPMVPGDKEFKKALPVMVFIHGGSFLLGNSDLYGPEYFMDEDVILVTVHYRLGILGFLNTEDDKIRGNMGMKDQVEALRWIQKGISSFGGDPSRVTIFGESAGSACIHFLMLSNQTRGLFNNAISQSGTALLPWAFINDTKSQAFRVGKELGCDSKSSQELLNCLKKIPAIKFAEFHKNDEEFWGDKFGPSVEYPQIESNRKEAFLLEPPAKIASEGNYNKVPWILGVTTHEGCILAAEATKKIERINENWNAMDPLLVIKDKKALEKVREHFFGDRRMFSPTGDLQTFTRMLSERLFYQGVLKSATYHVKGSKGPLYLYYFCYPGRNDGKTEFGIGHIMRIYMLPIVPTEVSLVLELVRIWVKDFLGYESEFYGVCHADDLKYLFQQNPFLKITKGTPNYEFSKGLIKTWVQFAAESIPNENWRPSDSRLEFFNMINDSAFSSSNVMITNPFQSMRKFWDQLQIKE